jgi:hypothetical protein
VYTEADRSERNDLDPDRRAAAAGSGVYEPGEPYRPGADASTGQHGSDES